MNEHALDTDTHHEHHEEASIFPPINGIGVGIMLFGIAANWNKMPWGGALILIGLTVALVGMVGWWWELVQANKSDETTLVGTPDQIQKLLRFGFMFFLLSEVMFFGAFFGYYFYIAALSPTWPPPGYAPLPLTPAIINTALLVTSGFLYMKGEHDLVHGKPKGGVMVWMGAAILLGLIFLGVQVYEWYELMVHEGFTAADGTFGTSFYLLTGFHGMHVIIGVIFLITVLARVGLGHFTGKKHFAMTAAGWYWHFVDIVWIGLVLVLYVWPIFTAPKPGA